MSKFYLKGKMVYLHFLKNVFHHTTTENELAKTKG